MPAATPLPRAEEAYAACRGRLQDYPVTVEQPVAWGEMDALGHVNNIVYFRYFESARIAYFERIGFAAGTSAARIGPILAETNCRFRTALHYPDYIAAGARVTGLESDRFLMEYAIAGYRADRLVATGSGLVVAYDYDAGCKASLPDPIVASIRRLEGLV